jgi:hypothetical protein
MQQSTVAPQVDRSPEGAGSANNLPSAVEAFDDLSVLFEGSVLERHTKRACAAGPQDLPIRGVFKRSGKVSYHHARVHHDKWHAQRRR